MKKNYTLLALSLIITWCLSCKKSDIAYENEFEKSYRSWQDFKASSANSYRYKVVTGSWTGTTTETVITVKNGMVVQRSYVYKIPMGQNLPALTIKEQWDEDLASLNTHPNAFATLTLDEVYQKAKTGWLLKRDDAKTSFETKNNGMISSAGYVQDNCADDCFIGVTISSIEKAE